MPASGRLRSRHCTVRPLNVGTARQAPTLALGTEPPLLPSEHTGVALALSAKCTGVALVPPAECTGVVLVLPQSALVLP